MFYQLTKRLLVLALLVFVVGACTPGSDGGRGRRLAMAPNDTHLTVHWPANPAAAQPPVTFKIPREYVDERTIWLDDKGIRKMSVAFGLPGLVPQKNSTLDERKAFMKRGGAYFRMGISRDFVSGERAREGLRRAARNNKNYMRDADVAGLERYSMLRCFTPAQLAENPIRQQFLADKPADDPSPDDCRLDRLWADLASPEAVTSDTEGVYMRCMSTGCTVRFSVAGRGAHLNITHDKVERWRGIVEPARRLALSFVVDTGISKIR